MIYLCNLILSVSYLFVFRKKKVTFIIILPMLVLWLFILGLQYEVGTDYSNYLLMFNNENYLELYYNKQEYLYFYFVKFFNYLYVKGQGMFFVISILQVSLFYWVQKKINIDKLYIFVFLYLTIGSTFYNQMNVIRSQTAVYFFTLVLLSENYYKKLLFFMIGINIHRSLLLLSPIIFLEKMLLKINENKIKYLLIISLIASLFPIVILLKKVVIFIPRYSHYLNYDYFTEIPFKLKLTKYLYIPIYIRSLTTLNLKDLREKKLYKLGIIATSIRLLSLISTVTNRIGEYFIILSLIPLYYYFKDLKKDKTIKKFFLVGIIFIFLIKVLIIPIGEYDYKSYLFN